MPQLGYALLLLAFVVTVYTGAAAIVGHRTQSLRLVTSARFGVYGVFMAATEGVERARVK